MMALIQAETQRLLSRRMTRFFPLGLAVLMIVGIVIAIVLTDDGPHFVDDIASGFYGVPEDKSTSVLGPMGFLIPIMAFVIGASYFGADQKAGMIEQLLTWEPRRTRLLAARALGGMLAVFVITLVLSAFLVVLLYIFSAMRGSTDGAFDIWATVLGALVRSGIVGALFFALGLAVTVILNNSVASIVGFLIYAFVIETVLLRQFLPKWSRWLPMENADAFVARNGVGDGGFFNGAGFGELPDFHHNWWQAGLAVASASGLMLLIAAVLFNRRDVG